MHKKTNEDKKSIFVTKIKIDGKRIIPSTHVKYLGILIDQHLKWNFQINELSTKLSRAIGMLSKIRYYVNQKTVIMIYYGIFASLLLYGSQIWGQSNSTHRKIKKIQNKAIRIINFKPKRHSVDPLYKICKILKFEDSINLANFLHLYVTVLH